MAAYPLEKEISLRFSQADSRNGFYFLHHARRELDVEVFDREFAGDEAGKKFIPSLYKVLIFSQMRLNGFENWGLKLIKMCSD